VTTQVDQGVTISSVPVAAAAGSGVDPAWAVEKGWAIIGSNPAEVRSVLDSHSSGSNITTSPSYRAVTSRVGGANNGMFYVDVPSVLRAIRNALPVDARTSFDATAGPYVNHLGAVELSSRNAPDHLTFSLFVQIR
jgi:hypothetical protein